MKIASAPVGGQKKIKGNVVNVPADVTTTITSLPRVNDDNFTIQVNLKRRLKYTHSVMSQIIRPAKVREAAKYLTDHSTLVRNLGIVYDHNWNSVPESEPRGAR